MHWWIFFMSHLLFQIFSKLTIVHSLSLDCGCRAISKSYKCKCFSLQWVTIPEPLGFRPIPHDTEYERKTF
jgi:hypothetical protein